MPLYLGDFGAGSTIYVPFHTFSSDDPSASMTITGLAATDIEIYKNGNTTQRASDSGYTLLDTDGIDFDGITGIHGISIDTSDNTASGFFVAGADYWVVVSSITLDVATINFVAAVFSIENRRVAGELISTTIATLASQTSFTLTAGSADDNAYNNCILIAKDPASAIQKCVGYISDYTGASKTITLAADPAIFTMAIGDNVSIIATSALANVYASGGTAQTPNDNGADINSILDDTGSSGVIVATNNDKAGYGLADDAITAGKYDESTAFPVASADSGATQIARVGADGDTLETLSDQIDAVPTAPEIQAEMEENGASTLDTINDKLPTNYIMGSSVQTDKDDEIDAVKAVTDNLPNSGALTDIDTGVNNIEGKLPSKSYLAGSTDADGGIDSTEAAVIQGEVEDAIEAKLMVRTNTAQAGGSNTITLDAGASATNDWYVNQTVFILSGTGAGQSRKISSYVGATKVATLDSNWATNPDNTSVFIIFPNYILTGSGATAAEVWAYATRILTANTNLNDPTAASIRTEIDLNSTQLADIVADTNELQADWANDGRLDLLIDAIKAVTDALPDSGALTTLLANVAAILSDTGTDGVVLADGAITAAKFAAAAITAAAIAANTIGASELAADAVTEIAAGILAASLTLPGQTAPPNAPTLEQALGHVYKRYRNKKTETSSQFSLFDDAGAVVDQKATVSDDGSTATVGEIVSGP